MNRRRFLVGLSGATAVATGTLSSQAFSSVESERPATVTIVNDDEAYLRFIQLDPNYAHGTDQIEFRFDSDFPGETNTDDQGDGVGSDSIYEFTGVFGVENQGTNPVRVFGIYDDDALNNVQLREHAPNPSSTPLTENSRSTEIQPGESVQLSMVLDTTSIDLGTYTTTITIVAAADDSHVFP